MTPSWFAAVPSRTEGKHSCALFEPPSHRQDSRITTRTLSRIISFQCWTTPSGVAWVVDLTGTAEMRHREPPMGRRSMEYPSQTSGESTPFVDARSFGLMMVINTRIQTSTMRQQQMPIRIRDARTSHLKRAMT